jgi:hypothetical protein
MDPNAALEELRRLVWNIDEDTAARAAELFVALDDWLSAKNFLPKAWDRDAVHFDSRGLVHGLAGYAVVMKNPFEWEARGNPDGFWVDYVTWKDWAEKGDIWVTRMSFRRATHVKPITHEELNATK